MSPQPSVAGPGPHADGGRRRTAALAALLLCVAALPVPAAAATETSPESAQEESFSGGANYRPGAPGLGDPYFPLDGNGGYDVDQYELDLSYDPLTNVLGGTATITAKATQDLSAFNLDLDGLTVRGVTVKGRSAEFTRDAGELTVTPQRGIRDGSRFITQVGYDGVPETIIDPSGQSGFFHTDDGSLAEAWQHTWLNEGFATFAEWLWSEREGLGTVQAIFDSIASIPADNRFWSDRIGDLGPEAIFDSAAYARGAMTLHALRQAVGDEDFSASCASGRNSTPAATSPQMTSSPSPKRSRARN